MRILMINSEYPPVGGGASNASANIAQHLLNNGHEVIVLTSRYGDLPRSAEEQGVRVFRGPAKRKRKDRSSAWEQGLFMVLGGFKAFQLVRQFQPQVTFAFFGAPSGIIAWFLKAIFGIPYVVSLRGGDVPGFRKYDFWLYHLLITPFLHVVWKQAYRVVANSQGLRQLAQNFNNTVKIDIIPNGVNLEKFSETQRSWDPPKILAVGRLVYQKGFELLLKALSGLSEDPWELTVVGDGPRRPLLEKKALDLGISARVHFVGWQDKAELPHFYQEANLFVLPSRNEGMSNAVLEAMASNLPVIATRIAGNEELINEGKTGLLIPPESFEALRTALHKLMGDPKYRQEMGRAGRTFVEQNYSWKNTAAQYQVLLEEAVAA